MNRVTNIGYCAWWCAFMWDVDRTVRRGPSATSPTH